MEDDLEDINILDDKKILNESLFLHKSIDRALAALTNSIIAGKFQDGLVIKNLEADQAVNIGLALNLFTEEELNKYVDDNKKIDIDNTDKLITAAKLSNIKLAFLLKKIKAKRPMMLKGVI